MVIHDKTYLTAAKRHAGGRAATSCVEAAKRARKRVDLAAYMVKNMRLFLEDRVCLDKGSMKESDDNYEKGADERCYFSGTSDCG